ncbi:MAG: flagellar basal body rod protein FlgB [Xanthobacteraceae bacterium]
MAIGDVPLLSMLRSRMQWHQERQRVLAENVANSNMPKFRPRDLKELKFDQNSGTTPVTLVSTNPAHFGAIGGTQQFGDGASGVLETRPDGNAVNLEDEMIKVAQNQMDYQAATAIYSRSLGLLKIALGKK